MSYKVEIITRWSSGWGVERENEVFVLVERKILPITLSSALEEMTPCLFSAMHWYLPESVRFRFDIVSAPFSIWILP